MKGLKKYSYAIALTVLAVCFFIAGLVGIFANSIAPSKAFTFGVYDDDKVWTACAYQVQDLSTSEDDREYHSVWASFASIDYTKGVEEIVIRVQKATATSSNFSSGSNSKKTFKNTTEDLNIGGWVKLFDYGDTSTHPYFIIATRNKIKINEIVFVGEKDGVLSQLSATAYGSGYTGSGETSWATKLDESSIAKDAQAITDANKLINEQNTFDVSLIKGDLYNNGEKCLYASETSIISSINGLIDGRGTVSTESNPLGLYLMALGKAIGGSYGLRVTSLLFAVGSIILLYFIGKKIFKENLYAFILAVCYAISGYALSYATIASVNSAMTFFILLAFYFAYNFSNKDLIATKDTRVYARILISGLALSLALAIKAQALFFIPVVLAPVVYSFAKFGKTLKNEKRLGFGILITLISYLLLPTFVLTGVYGLGAPIYITKESSLVFGYGFVHFVSCLKDGFGSSLGYIINLGVESFSDSKFALGNVVLSFGSIVATIYLATIVIKLLSKGENKNYAIYKQFLCLVIGYLGSYLLSLLFAGDPSVFALSLIFGSALILIALKRLDKINKIKLFNGAISLVNIVAIALLVASIVVFAIGVPISLGL